MKTDYYLFEKLRRYTGYIVNIGIMTKLGYDQITTGSFNQACLYFVFLLMFYIHLQFNSL